jgi:signal transduction histidine kinase
VGSKQPAVPDIGKLLLEVRVEPIIAAARCALAAFALVAILVEPVALTAWHFIFVILLAYLLYSAVVLFFVNSRSVTIWEYRASFTVDVAVVAALMFLSKGASSPFFVFFTFVLLVATLRWHSRGAITTAMTLVAILMSLALTGWTGLATQSNIIRLILRGGYLVIIGGMLAYVGAYLSRSRDRFAKLAAWPATTRKRNDQPSLGLDYAAEVLGASRILCVWDNVSERDRHFLFWANGHSECEYSSEPTGSPMGTLMVPVPTAAFYVLRDRCIVAGEPSWLQTKVSVDQRLREKYHIVSAAIAPFSNSICNGYFLGLDCRYCSDLLLLATIVANRIGSEIERDWLTYKMQKSAIEHERSRIARNVHDGVLQALTASTLNLKICARDANAKTRDRLDAMRLVLAGEQRRVRALIDQYRVESSSLTYSLAQHIGPLISELRACWLCEIPVQVKPETAVVAPAIAQNLHFMLAEAVANAAKHGKANRVTISVEHFGERLGIDIHDNGVGFLGLAGTYSGEELSALSGGPRSLRERVEELGGSLTLSTSSAGAHLNIQLPT